MKWKGGVSLISDKAFPPFNTPDTLVTGMAGTGTDITCCTLVLIALELGLAVSPLSYALNFVARIGEGVV